jgi:hypothetical protein
LALIAEQKLDRPGAESHPPTAVDNPVQFTVDHLYYAAPTKEQQERESAGKRVGGNPVSMASFT